MNGYRPSRGDVALRILCAQIVGNGPVAHVGENEVRDAFRVALEFERVSEELGGTPVRSHGRARSAFEDDDD